MAEGIRVGIGRKQVYLGEITLASRAKTITIPNPTGSASKVEKITACKQFKQQTTYIQMFVAFPKANQWFGVQFTSSSNSAGIVSCVYNSITVTDESIAITYYSNFDLGTYYWEVVASE